MRLGWLVAAIAAGALTVPMLGATPAGKAAAARDWTLAVAPTPEGGFRMGNPNAPVKLVEFGSLTCPHCAHFAAEGVGPLVRNHVRTGKVSWEFRNYVLNPYDLAAALLSNCAAPTRFFPLTERLYATQKGWSGKFAALTPAQIEELQKLESAARLKRIAAIGGLDAMVGGYGITPARAQACLADPKGIDKLMEIRRVAMTQHGVEGTPSFLVNGRKVDGSSWAELEPQLKPPGR